MCVRVRVPAHVSVHVCAICLCAEAPMLSAFLCELAQSGPSVPAWMVTQLQPVPQDPEATLHPGSSPFFPATSTLHSLGALGNNFNLVPLLAWHPGSLGGWVCGVGETL